MHVTYADRRLAGNEPGFTNLWAPFIGKAAARKADRYALQIVWYRTRRLGEPGSLRLDTVDNLEEERRSRVDADEGRISCPVKITDPDDQHIGAEHTRCP